MSYLRANELRRMRPYLGTFVEIGVVGLRPSAAAKAVERAFNCIATVDARMSAHNPASDLGRLYRAAPNTTLRLHAWTIEVIGAAVELHRLSDGVFDITVGNILAQRKWLPQWDNTESPIGRGSMADFALLDERRIFVHRPSRIDLGGIAKGFAVDRAMEALLAAQPSAAWVNAGGDMRTFGAHPCPLLVRDPAQSSRILQIGTVHNGAAATSGGYFNPSIYRRALQSPLINGRSAKLRRLPDSITVVAKECMWADGLTKVLALEPQIGVQLLRRYAATAWLLKSQRLSNAKLPLPELVAIAPNSDA
jgi:thiamine biosynthesis lipoprotein